VYVFAVVDAVSVAGAAFSLLEQATIEKIAIPQIQICRAFMNSPYQLQMYRALRTRMANAIVGQHMLIK
jgi:hypothetical protein